MKTYSAKPQDITAGWYLVNAQGKVLGRLAAEIARRLRGKHKPEYTPHMDVGDYIIVINAADITVTGNKVKTKKYYDHSGYPGGIYESTFEVLQSKKPGEALVRAVKGMLPKGPLGYKMLKKLKVYGGTEHPHAAQQPKELTI